MAQSSLSRARGQALTGSLPAARSLTAPAWTWRLAPLAVAGGAFLVYLATMAPTVTWLNGGADGAELAAAAWVGGVGHEPGYPLYLLLARLAQTLPLGAVVHRAAVLSATATALSTLVVYATVREILRVDGTDDGVVWPAQAGALFAAACWAFGPQVWSQATIAEVYGLTGLLLACVLWCLARWLRTPTPGQARLTVLALTLLTTHHPPFALLFVLLALIAWRARLPRTLWLQALGIMALGPLLMLTQWVRSASHPVLDWGMPDTPERWWAQVTARDYQAYVASQTPLEMLRRVPFAASLLLRQGGVVALGLGILGLSWVWSRQRLYAAILTGVAVFFVAFMALYNVRDVENYLLPTIQVLTLGAGVGVAWLLRWLPSQLARFGLVLLLGGSVAWQVWTGWPEVDVARDHEAHDWGTATLAAAAPDAVVRTDSDQHTFVLWYLQAAEGLRPDVAVVDTRMLRLQWYRAFLLMHYPRLADQGIANGPPPPPLPAAPPTRIVIRG